MARLEEESLVLSSHPNIFERMKEDSFEFDKLAKISDKLSGDDIVGAIVFWHRGDGLARYLVTKESPLTLQHIAHMDGYQVEYALIRGLRKQDVLDMLEHRRKVRDEDR